MRILHRNKTHVFTSRFSSPCIGHVWRVIVVLFSCLAVYTGDVYAAQQDQQSATPPILDALTLVEERTQKNAYTPLTLSALIKINGEWVAEQERLIEGQTFLKAFELSSPYTIASVKEAFKQFYKVDGAQLIFKCNGFDCGSSNAWANERFLIKQLYGLDANQQMFVWQLNGPRTFDVVYVVQRGNRRQYALWQRIVPKDQTLSFQPGAAIYKEMLDSGGAIRISDFQIETDTVNFDKEQIKRVAQALNEEPFRLFHLKVRAQTEAQSSLILDSVEGALIKAGVRKRRIKRVEDESIIEKGQDPAIEISWP